ncbi:MAG: hypothetical protein ACPG7K_00975 [Poseidonia sp.]
MDRTEVQSIDQGLFAFPKPTLRHGVGYFFSAALVVAALVLYSTSLLIPDVPRVEEATVIPYLHDDMSSYEYGPLQDGYNSNEYAVEAAFVVVPLELVEGVLAYDDCEWVEDDEGGGSWDYDFYMADAEPLTMMDAEGVVIDAAFSFEGSLLPEGEVNQPSCDSEWSRTIEGDGFGESNFKFNAFVMVEEEPPRYQLLSVVEIGNLNNPSAEPQEVTQREDRGRWALLNTGISGLLFMYSTSPPLLDNLRKLRKANRSAVKDISSAPGMLGLSGRYFPHFGPNFEPLPYSDHLARSVEHDWLFGAPAPTTFNEPYAGDQDGRLMPEHPNIIGTPKAALLTPYSIGAIVFAGSFIWLSADLRARDGSEFHTLVGWGMTTVVTVVNILWFFSAWKQFKLNRLIRDLPTSPIRSVAVGQAELVGQVRPSVAGTPEMSVGGRTHKGLVCWQWKSYEYVCRTDSDGDTHCSWEHRETKDGGVPFMVHDGSGGMLIDPSLWQKKPVDYGPLLDTWQRGDWKWNLVGIGVGDPIYILGDCVPRDVDHIEKWGGHETLPQALLTMVPTTGTGDASIVHYGTEMDVLAKNRSLFEIFIVPLLIFLFGIFMFINYTP